MGPVSAMDTGRGGWRPWRQIIGLTTGTRSEAAIARLPRRPTEAMPYGLVGNGVARAAQDWPDPPGALAAGAERAQAARAAADRAQGTGRPRGAVAVARFPVQLTLAAARAGARPGHFLRPRLAGELRGLARTAGRHPRPGCLPDRPRRLNLGTGPGGQA